MKKIIRINLMLLLIFLLVGCKSINESNNIKITENSEKIITEYIDNNAEDIHGEKDPQKFYTAFKVLGTSDDKIYLWVLIEAFGGTSIPVVLNVENTDDELIILSHNFPIGDGEEYSTNKKKLLPKGILPETTEDHNDIISNLEKIIEDKRSLDQG